MSDPPTQPPAKPPVPKPRAMTKIPSTVEAAAKTHGEESIATSFRARSSSDITSSMKRGVTPPTKATFTKNTPIPLPRVLPPNSSKTTNEEKSDAPVPKNKAIEEAAEESNEEREEGAEPEMKPHRRRRHSSEDSDSGPDYENIDAHLDDDLQAAVKRSDYVNWVYQDSDAEDEEPQYTGVRRVKPSVPLTSHPVLRKSQSATDLDKSTEEPRPHLERPVSQQPPRQGHEGPRPRNRAPPPPPSATKKEREKTQELAADSGQIPGHKRSKSDLPGQTPPPTAGSQEGGSPRVAVARGGGTRSSGRRPAPSYPAPSPETNPKQAPPPQSTTDAKHDGIYATPQKAMKRNVKSREVIRSRASMEEKEREETSKPARDDRVYSKPQKSKETPSPKQDRVYSKPAKGAEHKKQDKPDKQVYSRSPKIAEKDKQDKSRPHRGGEAKKTDKAGVYARPVTEHDKDTVLAKPQRVYDKQDKQDRQVGKESPGGNIRPKRHAPPPPAGARKVSPIGSSPEATESFEGGTGREGEGEEERETSSEDLSGREGERLERAAGATEVDPTSTPPPKPVRQKIVGSKSSPCLDLPAVNSNLHPRQGSGGREGRKAGSRGSGRGWEQMLDRMDLFTIELSREEGKGLGMMIVSGKVRSGNGAVVEGIFVQKVIPRSTADKDGRIQPGDMLVEISGQRMVNGSLEDATQRLRESTSSIKLRIGRPDLESSVFANSEDGEEPIYVNELMGSAQRELFIKLEKAEIRIAELQEEKMKADHGLKAFMEAEENKKKIQKEMEQLKQEFDKHKSESQQNVTNLTQALATITMDKAKNVKELEQLREQLKEGGSRDEEIAVLKQQLLKAQEDKREVERSLETYEVKEQEVITLSARVSELETQIAQTQQERDSAQSDLQRTRTELSSALEQVAALDTQNTELSRDLEQVRAETAQQASRRTAEVELSQRSQELSSARQELGQSRVEQERLSEHVAELSKALEREEARRARLEESLESQKSSENSNTADMLKKLQLQAQEIAELKEALGKRSTPTPPSAAGKSDEEDDEGIGPAMTAVPDDSDTHVEKETELKRSASKPEKPLEETGQTEPSPQAQMQQDEVPILQNGVHHPDSTPEPLKPIDENLEPSRAEDPPEEKLKSPESAPQGDVPREPQSNEETPRVTDFDAIRPVQRLDSSTALHKSEMGAHLRRKKPSREYIRSMGSMTDILEGLSMQDITETDETKKPESEKASDGSSAPVVKPKIIPRKESPTNEATELKKPKPMPRAAPRHGKTPIPKPEPPPTCIQRPQAAPRHKREHSGTQNLEPETKPSPSHQRVPAEVLQKPESDVTSNHEPGAIDSGVIDDKNGPSSGHKREHSGNRTHEEKEKHTPKQDSSDSLSREAEGKQSPSHKPQIPSLFQRKESSSPKCSPSADKKPMKPSPKHSKPQPLIPKHLQSKLAKAEPEAKDRRVEPPNPTADNPHHPSPVLKLRQQVSKAEEGDTRVLEHRDSELEELLRKDPSELSVKEKALLAQRTLEKRKDHAPPPVPRKPSKLGSEDSETAANVESETSPVRERTKSFDEHESVPQRFKKIPAGAVNIFGSPMRIRSATVATDEPDTRRESIERSGEHSQHPELPSEPHPRENSDAEVKIPPKRPPPPVLQKVTDMKSSPKQYHYRTPTSNSEVDGAADSSGELTQTESLNPPPQAADDLDYDNVLEWSSDQVATWLTKIGLSQHRQTFQEEGVQGIMLFDLDSSRLKALGMSSHDERSVLKKEAKALKHFADKQKKALEKKRREERKQGKKNK